MVNHSKLAQQILDTALMLAEKSSWEVVRLHDVAAELNITLRQINDHYRQKDDLTEVWFDRADRAMLEDATRADYLRLPSRDRVHRSIMTWLNAMSGHRQVTGQMLLYKLEFGHVHLQALGIMRISRTVQWILEAARRNSVDFERVFEEIALTTIYLSTFAYWLRDGSSDSARTSIFLDTSLKRAQNLAHFTSAVWPLRSSRNKGVEQDKANVQVFEKISIK